MYSDKIKRLLSLLSVATEMDVRSLDGSWWAWNENNEELVGLPLLESLRLWALDVKDFVSPTFPEQVEEAYRKVFEPAPHTFTDVNGVTRAIEEGAVILIRIAGTAQKAVITKVTDAGAVAISEAMEAVLSEEAIASVLPRPWKNYQSNFADGGYTWYSAPRFDPPADSPSLEMSAPISR